MKTTIVFLLWLLLTPYAHSQQSAITDTGETVYLYADGTWVYESEELQADADIPTNPTTFTKPDSADFKVRSKIADVDFWIDSSKWKFQRANNNPDAEYEFQLKEGDLYGMAIIEEIEIKLPELAGIALQNARSFAPDARVVEKEYREVNGKKVLRLRIDGTGNGIEFTYIGHYYSDASGSTQFIAYTAQSLLGKYEAQIENFLNGIAPRD